MIRVDKDHVSKLMLAEAYSEKHKIEERIKIFKKNYQKDFLEFEKNAYESEESFDQYDSYMEWKAYEKYLKELNEKIKEIQSGNIQFA